MNNDELMKVIDYWKFKNRHYVLKSNINLYWSSDYIEELILTNVILNKRLTAKKINDSFSLNEIQAMIINYSLFMLEIQNEKLI